jgi:hypothetical protein
MNTYTWRITSINVLPELNSKKDVVVQVKFIVTGTDSLNNFTLSSSQELICNEEESFIEYTNLTEQQVIEWVKSALGESGQYTLTKEIDAVLEQKKNVDSLPINIPLPWKSKVN